MGSRAVVSNTVPASRRFVPTGHSRKSDHRFFTVMAFAMAAGVFGGFTETYFARSYFHSPVIPFWVHVHGAVFTAWILFYLLQQVLATNGGMKLHRNLGLVGLVLATGVFIMGLAVATRQAMQHRFFPFPDAYSSLAVSVGQMVLFALFIGVGLSLRRDGETHKRLIMMSTQLFFFPAFGRLFRGLSPGVLLLALAFYFAGPLYDRITRGRVHKAYRWGVPALVLTMPPFAVVASHAPLWRHLVDQIIG